MARTRQSAAAAAAALACLALAASADAAVTAPHFLSVTYNGGPTIEGEAYNANQTIPITVTRPDVDSGAPVTIARASARTDALGNLIVNNPEPTEPGDVVSCWTTRTPEILPGDTVAAAPPLQARDTMVIQNVTAGAPTLEGAEVVMRGTATDPAGRPLSPSVVAASLFAENRWLSANALSGERVLNADALRFDAPGSSRWTARFVGLGDRDRAVALDSAAPSAAVTDAAETASTVFEVGGELGPLNAPCTAPLARNAVTGLSSAGGRGDIINSQTGVLSVSGLAQSDARAVAVVLDDTDPATAPVTVPGAIGGAVEGSRSWSASVPRAALDGLRDTEIRASGRYALPGGTIAGATATIAKDTTPPAPPTTSTAPGKYGGSVSTTLSAEAGARIVYTTNGASPTGDSPSASGPVTMTGPTTLTALAIDGAGNASGPAAWRYEVDPTKLSASDAARFAVRIAQRSSRRSFRLARRQGLTFFVTVSPGTTVLRARLYRGVNRRRLVASTFRQVRRAGRYRLRLKSKAMRRKLRRGTYTLRVDAGPRRGAYGEAREIRIRLR
jgi:hypothetical protein